MALEIAVVKKKAPTIDTTLDFTETGFGTPVGAMFFANDSDVNGTATTSLDIHSMVGFTDGTNERIAMVYSNDAETTSDTKRTLETGKLVKRQAIETGSFNSWITDGVRLDWSSSGAYNEFQIICVLLKGCDVDVGTFTPSATQNATSSLTGLSYEPDFAFFSSIGSPTPATTSAHSIFSFGCAYNTDSILQGAVMSFDENGQGTIDSGIRFETDSIGGQFFNNSLNWTGEITSFNADGFTMTTRDGGSGGDDLYYLTIGNAGTNIDFKIFGSPTAVGTDKLTTSFQTDGMFGAFAEAFNTDSNLASEAHCFYGANNNGEEHSVGVYSRDGVSTSDVANITNNKIIHTLSYAGANSFNPSVVGSIATYDSDGITLSYSNVGGNPRWGWAVIVGEVSGATNSTATPALASVSTEVQTATASASVSSIASPALASVSISVGTATALSGKSVSASPALASVTLTVNQATAIVGISTISSPALADVSVTVNQPTTTVSTSRIAQPAVSSVTITVNDPTVSAGVTKTATPALASVTLTFESVTALVSQSRIAQPGVSLITVTIPAPTVSVAGAGANITVHIRNTSQIEKYVTLLSAIEK